MIPRPYQANAVSAIRAATAGGGGTMISIATGGGKTAIAGFYLAEERPEKALVLQHTDELIDQNKRTICGIAGRTASIVKAEQDDWSGDIVFASIATLARARRRARMPAFSHLVIDECHRAAANSYQAVIGQCRDANPGLRYLGMTATPGRGDNRSLRDTFGSVSYSLSISRLIDLGVLVPPVAYTIDLDDASLSGVGSVGGEYDMDAVAAILNAGVHNAAVVEHWRERAEGRQTILFCATVQHADDVAAAFCGAGIRAEMVSGETPRNERRAILQRLADGTTTVVANCMVLTEGFDQQTIGCIGILRPMAHQGTLIQAIGRGLRMVDQARHPGVIKTDCIILDFAGALARHGSLEMCLGEDTRREKQERGEIVADDDEQIGEIGDELFGDAVSQFTMREINIIAGSPFGWSEIDKKTLSAAGFEASAFVVRNSVRDALWYAVGRIGRDSPHTIVIGDRAHCIAAADDFLRQYETSASAKRSRAWKTLPATDRQTELLRIPPCSIGRYEASCRLSWKFARREVKNLLA